VVIFIIYQKKSLKIEMSPKFWQVLRRSTNTDESAIARSATSTSFVSGTPSWFDPDGFFASVEQERPPTAPKSSFDRCMIAEINQGIVDTLLLDLEESRRMLMLSEITCRKKDNQIQVLEMLNKDLQEQKAAVHRRAVELENTARSVRTQVDWVIVERDPKPEEEELISRLKQAENERNEHIARIAQLIEQVQRLQLGKEATQPVHPPNTPPKTPSSNGTDVRKAITPRCLSHASTLIDTTQAQLAQDSNPLIVFTHVDTAQAITMPTDTARGGSNHTSSFRFRAEEVSFRTITVMLRVFT